MKKRTIFMALILAAVMSAMGAAPAGALTLIPGGQSIGVAVSTGGLVVTGASDVGATPSPGRLAGLRAGDVITRINDTQLTDVASLSDMLTGESCRVVYTRNGHEQTVTLTPAYDPSGGVYRLGLWVRQGTAGIGTLTYYNQETGEFGALGHAVTDEDSGIVLPVVDGAIYENSIINVEKGREGDPGEIIGQFYDGGYLGDVDVNTAHGVFGRLISKMPNSIYPDGIETAENGEIRTGSAEILTTVGHDGLKEYSCEIVRIHDEPVSSDKSFTVRITDGELIGRTGGIVQGMSGSPIIQDGKLVGAVTHVLVNDPTMGYGISIGRMLDGAA